MQSNRSRRGDSFQERDSEGRFASEGRRSYQNDDYGRYYDNNRNERWDSSEDDRDDYRGGQSRYDNDRDDDRDYQSQGRRGEYDERENYDDNYGPRGRYQEDQDEDYDDRDQNRYDEDDDVYERDERQFGGGYGGWNEERRGNGQRGMDYDDDRGRSSRGGNGRRGFAAMPREEVRRIAAEGGRARSRSNNNGGSRGGNDGRGTNRSSSRIGGNGRSGERGFASMPRSEVRRIAAMGGHASHGGGRGRSGSSRRGSRSRSRSTSR